MEPLPPPQRIDPPKPDLAPAAGPKALSARWKVGLCILMCLVIAGLGKVSSDMWKDSGFATPPSPKVPGESRQIRGTRAFTGIPKGADSPEGRAAESLLMELTAAAKKKDSAALSRIFDVDRTVTECQRVPGFPRLTQLEKARFITGIVRGITENAVGTVVYHWQSVQLRKVQPSDDGEDMIVYSRHFNDPVGRTHWRWWMTRVDGRWRIYDQEEFQTGLRMTTAICQGLSVADRPGGTEGLRSRMSDLALASNLMLRGQTEQAAKIMTALESDRELPRAYKDMVLLWKGMLRVQQGRGAEGLLVLDGLPNKGRDNPAADLVRASAYLQLGDFQKTIDHVRAFEMLLGETDDTTVISGAAQTLLGRIKEAAETYRRGLVDNPRSLNNLVGLAQVLPAAERNTLVPRFSGFPNPQEAFSRIARAWVASGDPTGLAELIAAHEKSNPGDPALEEYRQKLRQMKPASRPAAP